MKKHNSMQNALMNEDKQTDKRSPSNQTEKKEMTSKQVVAILGVVILVLLYIVSLIASIIDNSASAVWFRASLFGTVVLPLLIWIYVWLYGKLTGKHTMADSPENTAGLPGNISSADNAPAGTGSASNASADKASSR